MAELKPASTFVAARTAIVDKNGYATWSFIKILQDWDTQIRNGLSSQGNFIGNISPTALISGRTAIGTILQFIDDGGIVLAGGIDFSRSYINKDTDHIGDGTGSPLAGGKVAFQALVSTNPVSGETIVYNGSNWTAVKIAQAKPAIPSQWLNSYDSTTGLFTASQPAFSNISGTATAVQVPPLSSLTGSVTAAQVPPLSSLTGSVTPGQVPALSALSGAVTPGQVPALSALSGRITTGQLPSAGISVTITTAPVTVGGTPGSMTFTNGLLTAQVQAT